MPSHTDLIQAATCSCPSCLGLECLERPRYFAGMLLTEAELQSAQAYGLAKQRLHNRYLYGWGVVCGLQIVCHECAGWVTVRQGYAIDPCGIDVVVCEDHDFDALKSIRECREARPRPRADCDPVRRVRDAPAAGVEEHWCLTLTYEEQEARPMTALRREHAGSCSCNGKGGTCGCRDHSSKQAQTTYARSSARAQSGVGQTVAACEPTRIVEGYRLGVVRAPQAAAEPQAPEPGRLGQELERCRTNVGNLIAQAPQVGAMEPNRAYDVCCRYHDSVSRFLETASATRCELLDQLDTLQCPLPPAPDPAPPNVYLERVQQVVGLIVKLLTSYLVDCLCLSLLPPCPDTPQEDRLILACLTIRDDKIVHICHYEGRRQIMSFPTLAYWLSILPVGSTLASFFRDLCCGEPSRLANLFGPATNRRSTLTTGGLSNPGMLYESFASVLAQVLGADIATTLQPTSSVLDTRPLVGHNLRAVERELLQREIAFTVERVDEWWPAEAVAMSKPYAPAVVAVTDPLILYTKGKLVVGIDVLNETQRLRRELEDLKLKVAALENPIS
jgi:hypothetical protein